MNAPGKPYFTERQADVLANCIHVVAVVTAFYLPVMFACGAENFLQASGNVLLKGQGLQVILILISIFSVRFYVSVAVVFVLWRKGRFGEFRPFRHPLSMAPLEKVEYFAEEDKVRYGRLISFVFLPKFLAAITLGWFLMARNHCP